MAHNWTWIGKRKKERKSLKFWLLQIATSSVLREEGGVVQTKEENSQINAALDLGEEG